MKYIFLSLFFLPLIAFGQIDTTLNKGERDSLAQNQTKKVAQKTPFFAFLKAEGAEYAPKKAAFYSTIFPGGGQIYNRQYWKAPLALGGVATAGYFIYDNTANYRRYRDAYRLRVDGDPTTIDEFAGNVRATDAQLISLRDGYRKQMEQSYIALVVVYGLNVIEAYTAAHLKNFDISEDLSLQWQPTLNAAPTLATNMQLGVRLQFVSKSPTFVAF